MRKHKTNFNYRTRKEIQDSLVSPYPYVGIIESFDKVKGYGFIIRGWWWTSNEKIFFHIKNSMIKEFRQDMFVAFKVRKSLNKKDRIEAYNVNTIQFYTEELLAPCMVNSNGVIPDNDIIHYVNPDIQEKQIQKKISPFLKSLEEIESYIETFDIDAIIDFYKVICDVTNKYKPGEYDDVTHFLEDNGCDIFSYQKPWYSKYISDVYLKKIIPVFYQIIFTQDTMGEEARRRYKKEYEKIDFQHYEEIAKNKTLEFREQIKTSYNKNEHRETLIQYYQAQIERTTREYYSYIEKSVKDSINYAFGYEDRIKIHRGESFPKREYLNDIESFFTTNG